MDMCCEVPTTRNNASDLGNCLQVKSVMKSMTPASVHQIKDTETLVLLPGWLFTVYSRWALSHFGNVYARITCGGIRRLWRSHISGSRVEQLCSHPLNQQQYQPLALVSTRSQSFQHVAVAMYPPFDYFEHQRAWYVSTFPSIRADSH